MRTGVVVGAERGDVRKSKKGEGKGYPYDRSEEAIRYSWNSGT